MFRRFLGAKDLSRWLHARIVHESPDSCPGGRVEPSRVAFRPACSGSRAGARAASQFAQRRLVFKELDAETLAKIPPDKRPAGPIERHEITTVELPPLADMDHRVATLFGRAAQ